MAVNRSLSLSLSLVKEGDISHYYLIISALEKRTGCFKRLSSVFLSLFLALALSYLWVNQML